MGTPELGARNAEPGTRNPEPGTRNPEPGTRNPEPGTRNPERGTRNPELGTRNWHYTLATLAYALALLSKPAAVATPLILAVLDMWALRRSFRVTALALAPWVVLAVPLVLVTRGAQPIVAELATPLSTRLFVVGDTLAFYLWKLALPLDLAVDYGRSPGWVLAHAWGYLTWIVPAVLLALAWWQRHSRPLLLAAAGIFVAALLPVSGIVPFGYQSLSTTADRYLYVALLGPALALAWLLSRRETLLARAACGICLALLAALCSLQTLWWETDVALCRRTLQVNPRSKMAHGTLGKALLKRGELDEALLHFREDLRLAPQDPDKHNQLGGVLATMNRPQEAIAEFRTAIQLRPDYLGAQNNLGVMLLRTRRYAEAAAQFQEVLRRNPAETIARKNLQLVEERLAEQRRRGEEEPVPPRARFPGATGEGPARPGAN